MCDHAGYVRGKGNQPAQNTSRNGADVCKYEFTHIWGALGLGNAICNAPTADTCDLTALSNPSLSVPVVRTPARANKQRVSMMPRSPYEEPKGASHNMEPQGASNLVTMTEKDLLLNRTNPHMNIAHITTELFTRRQMEDMKQQDPKAAAEAKIRGSRTPCTHRISGSCQRQPCIIFAGSSYRPSP